MNLSSAYNRKVKLYSTILCLMVACVFLFFSGANDVNAASVGKDIPQSVIKWETTSIAGNWVKDSLGKVLMGLLQAVLYFFGWLLSVAAAIFAWTADAKSLTSVINGSFIYESWKIVRDLLNISFILMLLYTAFTIIFQVDKSNKKIILTVVLMALLVNFSFPIARFIIDIGNSLMYTIFQNLFGNNITNNDLSTIFVEFSDKSKIGEIINGIKTNSSPTQLIGAIVFVAILAITFLMIAMLFLLRIVALAIIIIFSPIGFVGLLFPSVASKIDWWGNLFKYTFFGPAMAFMIYIALQILKAIDITTKQSKSFATFASYEGTGTLITSMATYAVPVVVLWIGMGVAQQMGIKGADMAKGWATAAFNKVSGVDAVKKRFDAFKAERKKRSDEKFKGNVGEKFGNWLNRAQDTAHGKMKLMPGSKGAMKRADKWNKEANKADIKKQKEDAESLAASQIIDNIHDVNNKANASSADKIKRAGQASELLSRGKEFEDHLGTMSEAAILTNLGVDAAAAGGTLTGRDRQTAIAAAVRARLRQQIAEAEKLAKSLIREPLVAAGANVLKGAAGAAGVATIVGATAVGGPVAGAAVYAAAERLATGRRREDVKRMVTNPQATARLYRMKAKRIPREVGKFGKDVWNKATEDDPRDRARRP